MFIAIYKGEMCLAKHGGKDCCFAYQKSTYALLTIKLPNGSVLASKTVKINGTNYSTDSSGRIALFGNYGDVLKCNFSYDYGSDPYIGTAEIVFGINYTINLVLHTVTLTVRRYETSYQTLTTIYNGRTYNNEVTLKVVKGSSVRVYSGGDWDYTGSIIVNGTDSGKTDYTFTVITDTTVTTSQPYDDSSCGSEGGCGGGEA